MYQLKLQQKLERRYREKQCEVLKVFLRRLCVKSLEELVNIAQVVGCGNMLPCIGYERLSQVGFTVSFSNFSIHYRYTDLVGSMQVIFQHHGQRKPSCTGCVNFAV